MVILGAKVGFCLVYATQPNVTMPQNKGKKHAENLGEYAHARVSTKIIFTFNKF